MGNSVKYKGVAIDHTTRVDLIGTVYEGYLEPGEYTGHGKIKYGNQSIYTGEFRKGKPHGGGTMEFSNGRKISGDYEEGVLHGHAEISDVEGNILKGCWKHSRLHGQVIFTTEKGDVYEFVYEEGVKLWSRKALINPSDMINFLRELNPLINLNQLI